MRMLWVGIATLLLVLSAGAYARACHPLKSKIAGVHICYQIGGKKLALHVNGKWWDFPMTGYMDTSPNVIVLPSVSDTFVMGFIDLAGFSAGGNVELVQWHKGSLRRSCGPTLAANYLRASSEGNHAYVALMQHYTQNIYYAEKIIALDTTGWKASRDEIPWSAIVNQYKRKLKAANSRRLKGIYQGFISNAYAHVNNVGEMQKYESLARHEYSGTSDIIEANRRVIRQVQGKPESGRWCRLIRPRTSS